jgi:ATP phosphoribosyltransferase
MSSSSSATTTTQSPHPKRPRSVSLANETDILTFAIPKKGRLFDHCQDLLKGCGLKYSRNPRLDIAYVNGQNLKLKLVFLPAQDIARFVGEGNVDLGITGQDMIAESGAIVDELVKTEFGICQLVVQAPKISQITDIKQLAGKRIATSFPKLTEQYFKKELGPSNLPMPSIRTISGSVEAACALGLADAVVDLVETGTTMEEAGLEKVATVLHTQAVLVQNPTSEHKATIQKIKKRIEGYLNAKKFAMMYYNVQRTDLPLAEQITPGREAPTIAALEKPGWVSVGVMVRNAEVADVMDRLQELGAKDILVLSIENCRS